jgi:hypothetical protein
MAIRFLFSFVSTVASGIVVDFYPALERVATRSTTTSSLYRAASG